MFTTTLKRIARTAFTASLLVLAFVLCGCDYVSGQTGTAKPASLAMNAAANKVVNDAIATITVRSNGGREWSRARTPIKVNDAKATT